MKLTIDTEEYEILKAPFNSVATIIIHDYENKEIDKMKAYIDELEDKLADYKGGE